MRAEYYQLSSAGLCGREVEQKTRNILTGGNVDVNELLEDDEDFADLDLDEADEEEEELIAA